MTIQDSARFLYPGFSPDGLNALDVVDDITLDAANEKHAVIFQATKDGTISDIFVRISGVTSAGNLDIRLETVGSDGDPTGTLVTTNSNTVVAVSSVGDIVASLSSAASVTNGQFLAMVFARQSGSYQLSAPRFRVESNFPYVAHFDGTAWTKGQLGVNTPSVAIGYTDGSREFIPGIYGVGAMYKSPMNINSSIDERGNVFTLPIGMRAIGAWAHVEAYVAVNLVLYQDSDTVLRTYTIDPNRSASDNGLRLVLFSSPIILLAGVTYRLVLKATSTTNVFTYEWEGFNFNIATFPGRDAWFTTRRADGGSWNTVSYRFHQLGLIIDGIDVPAGSGGGGISRARVVNA